MSTQLEDLAIERDKLLFEVSQLKQRMSSEATFSINFQMIDKYGGAFQATIREGATKEVIKHVFETRQAFIELALDNGYRIPGRMQEVAPTQPNAPVTVAPPPPPVPANGNNGQAQESLCALIEVGTSYQGGKTQLKFHVNGLEHPLTYTKEVSEMAKLLAPLGYTAAHIVVGQKYATSCMVKWNQGEKYKNVLAVRPA